VRRAGRLLVRGLKWLGLAVLVAGLAAGVAGWTGFGRRAEGARRARMERSPEWKDGHFVNPQPIVNDLWGSLRAMLQASADASPAHPPPTVNGGAARFSTPPPTGLRVTWLGHSSLLVEIDGFRVLTDPMWSERSSPISWVGPRRWFAPPIALAELPAIDAVLISHDHYDHLDQATLSAMKDWNTTFVVPLGVAAHLVYWGVPAAHIVELDWWERTHVRGLEIVCTPSRHASGRGIFDKDATLWASYAMMGGTHRAFYSGDTGLFPGLAKIGEHLGPFDLTMIEVGQYHRAWPDWHLGPEQALRAHELLRGRVFLPIHWGLLQLAAHGWTEPIERARVAASAAHATILLPRPGQSVEPAAPPPFERWWPSVPWKTGAEDPIVSSQMN
jgi:L-ascorbate metabolism protein UlaG (beta-lactamase superfamily)